MNSVIRLKYNGEHFAARVKETIPNGYILEYGIGKISSITKRYETWYFANNEVAEDVIIEPVNYDAAFILPITVEQTIDGEETFVYLGRETMELKGKDCGTFDSFGGRVDSQDNNDPLRTACREFEEEGFTKYTLGLTKEALYEYVPRHLDKRLQIGTLVMYIVRFSKPEMYQFMQRYHQVYHAIPRAPECEGLHEKDEIAKVNLINLLNITHKARKTVSGEVIDLNGNITERDIVIRDVLKHLLFYY